MTARTTSKRRPVVLYQPTDRGLSMPLGLLALGSWLSGEHVVIVDGRFELAPEARVLGLARDALCLGVTVRTGEPLREAARVSAAARHANPRLAVVWGGAHATLDPASCLASGVVDACALGAGEEAMTAAAAALRGGHSLASVAELAVRGGSPPPAAEPPATLWPRADYSLLDVERHFEVRGARSLDYCSSRGARDGTSWSGLRAERVVAELGELAERYRLSEVLFRDEDFYADAERVEAIAGSLAEMGGALGWQGGARAEDLVAARPELLRLLAQSGCRKLHLAIPPGPPPRELLLEVGARLHAASLVARFVFEVEEPDRRFDGLTAAVSVARSLCAIDPHFETPVHRTRPAPAAAAGRSLESWAAHDREPWTDARAERRLARTAFFFAEAQRPPGRRLGKHLLRMLALVRVRLGFFALDFDRRVVEAVALLRTGRVRPAPPAD